SSIASRKRRSSPWPRTSACRGPSWPRSSATGTKRVGPRGDANPSASVFSLWPSVWTLCHCGFCLLKTEPQRHRVHTEGHREERRVRSERPQELNRLFLLL